MFYVPKSIDEIQWWDNYYRWHDLPRPNFEPIDDNPEDRVRNITTIYYIHKKDGSIEIKTECTGDLERDALEVRLISVLNSHLQQKQSDKKLNSSKIDL